MVTKSAIGAQRRLAAIFCADVAGYSRLMSGDERGTLRLLASHREIADREIGQHGGRIANTAGDSILAEFPNALDAVRCALAVQERIAAVNDAVPQEHRVVFRVGVHVGEVMVRNGDIFGDGVNVASRLQGLAPPGSVCLSEAAHAYVQRLLPLAFEDIGSQPVKGIDRPVRAFLTHPAHHLSSKAVPLVHSQFEFHLGRRFNRLCMAALNEIASTVALNAIDIPALASIVDEPNIGPRRLAERMGIGTSEARRITICLEARGFIERARSEEGLPSGTSFRPTPFGEETRLRLRVAVLAAQDRLLAPLSDHERETLKALLARVIEANSSRTKD